MNQGHRVSVFAKVIGRTNKDAGIYPVEPTLEYKFRRKLHGFFKQGSYDVFNWGRAIAAAVNRVSRADPIDVLEMEESFGWCADVQKRVSCPVVVKLHGPAFLTLVEEDRETEFAAARIEAESRGLRQLTSITAPSQGTLLSTISQYGLNPKIKRVIRNPIRAETEAAQWDLQHCDRNTLLFVGRFDKPKGGDTVLLAFRRLLELNANLKLIFVGPNWGLTTATGARIFFDEFRDSLFTKAQRPSINYLGELPRTDIVGLRQKAMLTVVASRWENQPNTALEAMIQGCPIVANDSGGISEIVEDKITGLLAKSDDIQDLCQKVLYMIDNPEQAQAMGKNAQRFVTERHSVKVVTQETVAVYREAVSLAKAQK
jgi:glycosyltransferase involved in cell wall biosynthesis